MLTDRHSNSVLDLAEQCVSGTMAVEFCPICLQHFTIRQYELFHNNSDHIQSGIMGISICVLDVCFHIISTIIFP